MVIAYSLYDRIAVARVRAAFDSTVLRRADAADIQALIHAPRGCAALLFDVHTAARVGMAYFEWLQHHRRTAALVLYVAAKASSARVAFQLGQWGIDGMCVQGEDDSPADLRRAVEAARLRAAAAALGEPLTALSLPFEYTTWATALAHVPDLRTATELATLLRMTERQLRARLREAGLPGPRRFLAWCRLLRAAVLLEDESRTTESAGLAVNYASGPAFRNACRYLVGVQPSEIRRRGGAAFVLERLGARVCAAAVRSHDGAGRSRDDGRWGFGENWLPVSHGTGGQPKEELHETPRSPRRNGARAGCLRSANADGTGAAQAGPIATAPSGAGSRWGFSQSN